MKLVVGLGNPGPKYERTRHNLGVLALHELLERNNLKLRAHKTNTMIAEHRGVIYARTRGYMNVSGGPVKALADFFKVTEVIVLFDDLEIDFGEVRTCVGDHGHNGLRSITKAMGKDYHRIGIGIGRPPGRMDVASYVLKPLSKQEMQELPIVLADAADAVEELL